MEGEPSALRESLAQMFPAVDVEGKPSHPVAGASVEPEMCFLLHSMRTSGVLVGMVAVYAPAKGRILRC